MNALQTAFEAQVPLDPTPSFQIGPDISGEARLREALLDRAMGPGRRRKASERLRHGRLPAEGLAFGAHDLDGRLVGTVRLWNIMAGTDASGRPVAALLLGPLAVDPAREGQGIGSALMRHAVKEAARLGHAAILLVGDSEYYERFGFRASLAERLAMPGPVERRRFLALELLPGALRDASGVLGASGRRALPRRAVTLENPS
jgi:predicted N-acetyltransferase YhbS